MSTIVHQQGNAKRGRSSISRFAFLELYHQGETDPNIAAKLNTSRSTVTRMRMKLGLSANEQKHFSKRLFRELYDNGLTDGQIATILGVSRSTILRHRKKNELRPTREKHQRGLGKVSPDKSYYDEVRRVMRCPEVCRYIYRASRRFRTEVLPTILDPDEREKYEKVSWIATVIHPRSHPEFVPGPFCTQADNLDAHGIRYIVSIEKDVERSNVAGVPGPQIFQLAESVKSGSEDYLDDLAMDAVQQAFMCGVHETVEYILSQNWEYNTVQYHQRSYINHIKRWDKIEEKCVAQAPCKEERPKRSYRWWSGLSSGSLARGSGKVGKKGGIQSEQNSIAWAAAQGY